MRGGDWEIAACLDYVSSNDRMAALPMEIRRLVAIQADLIRATARDRGNAALPAYTIVVGH